MRRRNTTQIENGSISWQGFDNYFFGVNEILLMVEFLSIKKNNEEKHHSDCQHIF